MLLRLLRILRNSIGLIVVSFQLAFAASGELATAPAKAQAMQLNYFAKVGADIISLDEYSNRLQDGMKEKFFHGKIPEKELKDFRRKVAQDMIDEKLFLQEAARRGIAPDMDYVEKEVNNVERKKRNDTYWQEHRDQLIQGVRKGYETKSTIKQLETAVRNVPEPTASEIQKYYKSNTDKFTAPERVKIHMILIKVDPSSSSAVWEQASKNASDIVKKIRGGEDFEELARIHSGDDSAANGGDMGYIHKGMLGNDAAEIVGKMKIGEISEPVFLLEGVAIFRLDDREQPRLNEYERVDDSAKEFLRKESGEKAWRSLTEELRKKTNIVINEAALN